ncbi:MAG: sigma-70 family RNA polymerase sigma factor [Acidobacteriota bacterium]
MAVELTVYELLKRCLERPPDEVAWQEFVYRYHRAIKASVAKTFRLRVSQETERRAQFPDDLIEDLVQTVYVRLVEEGNRALDRFEGEHENSIFRYLGIISINVVRDHFREAKAQKRPKVTFSLDELLDNAGEGGILKDAISSIDGNPIMGSALNLTMEDVEAALRRSVSRRHRDRDALIFKLRYFDGLTLEEIRKALGLDISPMGIGSILNRINGKLRARLTRPPRNL